MPTVLLCTTSLDTPIGPYVDAAMRAGVTLRVVSTLGARLAPEWRSIGVPVPTEAGRLDIETVVDGLSGSSIDGVLALDDQAARLAAHLARAAAVPWHAPEAVDAAINPLLTRGRMLAVGLPMPWFVTLPLEGDEGLDRLSRVRFPCVVKSLGLAAGARVQWVDDYATLLAARDRIASTRNAAAQDDGAATEPPMLLVEGFVPGREFALDGVLELGALRVFALCEKPGPRDGPRFVTDMLVTPARLASSRQQVLAGHVARAALALGLHHGPIHAWCRVDGEQVVVPGVAPRPIAGAGARAIPVVHPDGSRVGLEDVLLAHALGRSLEGFGHEALARGVLQLAAPQDGRGLDGGRLDEIRALPGVTAVHVAATFGETPGGSVAGPPAYIVAEAPQPGDVVEVLHEAGRRLRVPAGG